MTMKGTTLARPLDAEDTQPPPQAHTGGSSRELLTVHDVAALLHVPVSWVYEHTRRGAPDALPVVKVGKYVRFRPADLWDYIDRKSRVRSAR